MPVELEAKFKVPDLEPLRRRLGELKAESIGMFHETNIFFDTPDATLQGGGKGLRLRINQDRARGTKQAIITFKGSRQAGIFKNREELEIVVSDAEQTEAIFGKLGLDRRLSFEKHRESWKLDGCKIELDELPHLGTFLEIEGPNEPTIAAVQHQLGLDHASHISDSYPSLLSQWLKHNGRTETVITFAGVA